ncbi:Gfo/Idh/MocA family oxidoreductase [Microbacterium sediminicola]|uniref:Gfo/Idh/MocA family oxidoreductase n=1 Tax=Microbacterium sediminicola TaxID=415210 RepID=A0ABN2HHG1_9MICO
MSALRIGIVGAGFMGAVHARAARAAGARVTGIVASTPERGSTAAEELGIDRGFATLDEMLASGEMDVIHITTPNRLHAPQALAVLDAGLPVVCEKPLTTSLASARALADAAAGQVATVPFVYRFHPLVRDARARIAAGEIGPVITVRGAYLQDWLLSAPADAWRLNPVDGGRSVTFADVGSHLVDLLEFVTGDRIVRLVATARTVGPGRVPRAVSAGEQSIALTVEFSRGAIGSLLVSQVAPGRKNQLSFEIAGSDASVAFDQEHPETMWVGKRAASMLILRDAAQMAPDAARLERTPAGHPQGYQDAFTAFAADTYAAVAGAAPDGLPTFEDGVRAVQLTEAVLESAATGQWEDTP